MNHAQKIELEELPSVVFRCRVCGDGLDCGQVRRPRARADARAIGWDFIKVAEDGNKVEVWFCPRHVHVAREKLLMERREGIVAWSDDETVSIASQIEKQIAKRQGERMAMHSRFERYFGPALTGNEMAACMRLRNALDIVETAGNATASYDGIGVDSFSFGSKTLQDKVIIASHYRRQCETSVVGIYSKTVWRVLLHSIWRDFSPQDAGDFWARLEKESMGRDKRMAKGVEAVSDGAKAIIAIRY